MNKKRVELLNRIRSGEPVYIHYEFEDMAICFRDGKVFANTGDGEYPGGEYTLDLDALDQSTDIWYNAIITGVEKTEAWYKSFNKI